MNIFIFIKYFIATILIIFIYYINIYYFYGFFKSIYIYLVKITNSNNIKLLFLKNKIITKIICFTLFYFEKFKFFINYNFYLLSNKNKYKNTYKNMYNKNFSLLGVKKLNLIDFCFNLFNKIKITINEKSFFYKHGHRKNFYYNIFLAKKKRYTNWYWKIK